jgi:hypothetical protein
VREGLDVGIRCLVEGAYAGMVITDLLLNVRFFLFVSRLRETFVEHLQIAGPKSRGSQKNGKK